MKTNINATKFDSRQKATEFDLAFGCAGVRHNIKLTLTKNFPRLVVSRHALPVAVARVPLGANIPPHFIHLVRGDLWLPYEVAIAPFEHGVGDHR